MSVACEESDHKPLVSFASLYKAYQACRKGKRHTVNALRFEHDLLENLCSLEEELRTGAYRPSRSVCFVARQPKLREIFAADFRDRVVHHLLVPRLEAVFEPKFIHDSYACRQGKGTHAAVDRLREFMNSVTRGGKKAAWYLQLDVRNFFMSIDKEVLCAIMRRHVRDRDVLDLSRKIIMHDCAANYAYKGERGLLSRVPRHKTLTHAPPGKGLPIGNLTSQFFANVYLNELDQYVKHALKARCYLRYVDDFILLHESRDVLLAMEEALERFLRERLALSLKSGRILKRAGEGADFLGYIVRPGYVLVRNRVVGNLKSRLDRFEKRVAGRIPSAPSPSLRRDEGVAALEPEMVTPLRQILASYLGHFRHANTRRLTRSIFRRYDFLAAAFALETDRNRHRLVPVTEPRTPPGSFREQCGWFAGRYPDGCLFFRVGGYYELHGNQAARFGSELGLKAGPAVRGLGAQCGFPARLLVRYKSICMRKGIAYVVVAENGWYASGLKRRITVEIRRCLGGKDPGPHDLLKNKESKS
jgi:RNA-directed DNA polymerase